MNHPQIIAIALVAFSLAVYVFQLVVFLWAMRRPGAFARGVTPLSGRVSVLKPLAGVDDELLTNLESFARQEGCEYELLLGVASRRDPAWALAEVFVARHPELRVRLVETDPDAAVNPKVAQLIGLEKLATGKIVVISDANVRARPTYLRDLVAELAVPGTGLVSNVIMGAGEKNLGAAIDNLILSTHATPGVLAAVTVTGRAITVGKSMAMRRADLRRLGGFEAVARVLAEDHALGRRFGRTGLKVRVSTHLIENRNVQASLRRTYERHARWSKMRRAMAPTGLLAEPFLMPWVISTFALVLAPSEVTADLFIVSALTQMLGMEFFVRAIRGRWFPVRHMPLELVRSWVLFAGWVTAWASRRVEWRGHAFEIVGENTELEPARPRAWRRLAGYVRSLVLG